MTVILATQEGGDQEDGLGGHPVQKILKLGMVVHACHPSLGITVKPIPKRTKAKRAETWLKW
jgi:hypothetical protein